MNDNRFFDIIIMTILVLLTFAVYSNTLEAGFVWDDEDLVVNNLYIKNPVLWPKVFTDQIGAGSSTRYFSYRPLQIISYAIENVFFGVTPAAYHMGNIILHVAVVLLLYMLIAAVFGNNHLAAITSGLFAVSPLNVAAVAYVSGRADPLALSFMLLAFLMYVRLQPRKTGAKELVVIPVLFLAALLSRESVIVFPFLVLVYHLASSSNIKVSKFLPIALVAGFYTVGRMFYPPDILPHGYVSSTLLERLPGVFAALTRYLRLLVFPFDLHMDYGLKHFKFTDRTVIIGAFIALYGSIYALRNVNKDRLVFFSIMWFFVALLPVANIYPIPSAYMAEHWLYVPSIGFFVLISGYLLKVEGKGRSRYAFWILIFTVIYYYSMFTVSYNRDWRTFEDIYRRTSKYEPESVRTICSLAYEYHKKGDTDKAIELYERAIMIKPDYHAAYEFLGGAYDSSGRHLRAIKMYKKALSIDPRNPVLHNKLGVLYSSLERYAEAETELRRALEIKPDYAVALNNLGVVFRNTRRNKNAVSCYERAVFFDPGYAKAYNNLGNVLKDTGQYGSAVDNYKKAVSLDPGYGMAYANMASAYYRMGEHNRAIISYRKAKESGFFDEDLEELLNR